MRLHVVMKYIGIVLLIDSLFMFFSLLISIFNGLDSGFYPLLMSLFLTATLGVFPLIFVREEYSISKKESYVIIVGAWSISCLVGILPYILWSEEFTLVNALFESVSGFTTTGSTIISDVEALPRSMLFWRACTMLIGGAGVVVFALAVIPMMNKSRANLSSVEISPFVKDNYKFKMQKGLRILLYVYLFLVATLILWLRIAGMTWFDATCHAFSAVATGGFSTKNLSIAYYNSLSIEIILMVYMVLASMHFGLLFSSVTSRKTNIFKSEVSRYYLLVILGTIVLVTVNLWGSGLYGIGEALRYSSFQVISVISTTGFATTDTAIWPALSIMVIILISFQCGCAGSTAGGIKADRMLLIFKTIRARFKQMQHPDAIIRVRLSNIDTTPDLINGTFIFAIIYICTAVAGTLIITAMGTDLITAFSGSVACIGNIGPGFGEVSSMSNFAGQPDGAKYVYSVLMLAGRMEILGFFQIFLLSSWK